jgi:hypothetical protein
MKNVTPAPNAEESEPAVSLLDEDEMKVYRERERGERENPYSPPL